MNKSIITYTLMFIALVIVQALMMNQIVLFHCAVCYLFIYFLVKTPLSMSPNLLLTLGFLLGLSVDMLSDTPGVNALACTLLAAMKRPVFFAYEQHDDKKRDTEPGLSSMGWLNFSKYLLTMSAIYSLLATTIECLNFVPVTEILLKTAASAVFTFLIILALDSLFNKR